MLACVGAHLVALHQYGSGGVSVLPAAHTDTDTFYVYVFKDGASALTLRSNYHPGTDVRCRAPQNSKNGGDIRCSDL